jgi:D-aspartate ligase
MYAIVANCNYNGLSVIQELGRHGVDVRAFDSVKSIGYLSKYSSFVRCPDPAFNEDDFIAFLLEYGSRQPDRGVFFPTNDHWAVAISKHRDVLMAYYEIVAPPYEAIKTIIEKNEFYRWSDQFGYPVPKTWRLSNSSEIPSEAFPLVGKPEFRRTVSNDAASRKLQAYLDQNRFKVFDDRNDLVNYLGKHQHYLDYFVVQQYVRGLSDAMFTVGIYADRSSNVRAIFSGRKVRGFPPDHGDCILGQAEAIPAHVINTVKAICKSLNYTGIAEFEFKRDDVSGEFFLIEINPRSWSWVGITPACGVSLPWLAFRDITGQEIPEITVSKSEDGQVKYVKILEDFDNCMWGNQRMGYLSWSFTFREWRKTLNAEKLIIAEYQPDDIKPAIYALAIYFRRIIARYAKRLLRRH